MVKLQHRKDSVHHQVAEHVRNQTDVCKDLDKATSDIHQFQRYLAYLQLIENVEKIRYIHVHVYRYMDFFSKFLYKLIYNKVKI